MEDKLNTLNCKVLLFPQNLKKDFGIYTTISKEKIEVVQLNSIILNTRNQELSINKNSAWPITADTDVLVPHHMYFVEDIYSTKEQMTDGI